MSYGARENRHCTECQNIDLRVTWTPDEDPEPVCSRCQGPTRGPRPPLGGISLLEWGTWPGNADADAALAEAVGPSPHGATIEVEGGRRLTVAEIDQFAADRTREMNEGAIRHAAEHGVQPDLSRAATVLTAQEDRVGIQERKHERWLRARETGIDARAKAEYQSYANDARRRGEKLVTLREFVNGR